MSCFFKILPSRAIAVLVWLCVAGVILVNTNTARGPRKYTSNVPLSYATHDAEPRNCSLAKPTPPEAIDRVGLAPALSPADLLCRPLPPNQATIPKLFHQSWKSIRLPAKFERWSNSCRQQHPDWEWVLWTDEDNLRLVQEHFPWLLDTYLSLPGNIYRADLARNLYMHLFGGVYADLDTECLHPTSDALGKHGVRFSDATMSLSQDTNAQNKIAFFGRMGADEKFEHNIPNAWMAASPGHPFFMLPLQSAQAEMSKSRSFLSQLFYSYPSAEQLTGPIALRKSLFSYKSQNLKDKVVLLPEHCVYPFNWNTGDDLRAICSAEKDMFDERQCKTKLEVDTKGSISITYWSHTHRGMGDDAKNIDNVSHD